MKRKYLTLIPFLALNFNTKEVNANMQNINQINQNTPIDLIHFKNFQRNKDFLIQSKFNNFINLIAEKINSPNVDNNLNLNSLDIISDSQVQSENNYIAEGNVQIREGNMQLQTDKLIYDLQNKEIAITGNIIFLYGEQFLQASEISYNLETREGFIKDVYGTINFDQIDLKPEQEITSDFEDLSKIQRNIKDVELNKSSSLEIGDITSPQNLKLEINEMVKWRFQTAEIKIKKDMWFSDVLYLTNDPFNKPQLVLKNSDFSSFEKNGDLIFKSKWSSVILEDKLKIPIGPKNYKVNKGSNFKWGIGYERNSKDGLYITRYSDPIKWGKSTLKLENEFYIQRVLSGKTKSFSKENNSVLADKIEQDAKTSDYSGINADFNSNILGLDFNSEVSLNSLDIEKTKKIINSKTTLSKVFSSSKDNDKEKETKISLFGTYRDKVWNGSIGETDILSAYGIRLENDQKWGTNKISKSSKLAAGYGEYQSNKKSTKENIISRERFNIMWFREHNYHILSKKDQSPISNEFIFIPESTNRGLDFLFSSKVDLYNYSDGNFQNLITFKAGPKITLGSFKKNYLDYSELTILGKTTIANGESPFDFDQSVDNHSIEIELNQQIIGPLALKYSTEYNLDINSKKFHEFSNNIYELSWNRRAFNISLFYDEDKQAGGINFEINGFNFNGYGENFK